jgi:hypothetical protein
MATSGRVVTSARPATSTERWSRVGRAALGVALFGAAVVLPLLRQTGTHSWRTVWAEDGSIYFQEAYSHGALAVLTRGYAGYLQLPPRILGAAAQLVPTRDLALFFALNAAFVNAWLAWFVYWASDGWLTSRAARLALASLVILMPVLGGENTATITNTIWTFAAVAPWALISMDERSVAVVLRSLVAFLAATATALCVIFLPLAIGWALIRRTRATALVVATFCVGLLLQAAVALNTTDTRNAFVVVSRHASKVPELISMRVFAEYLLGDKTIGSLWDHRLLLAVLAPVAVLAVLALRFRDATGKCQLVAVAFVMLSVVSFVVPVWDRGTSSAALTSAEGVQFPYRSTSTAYVAGNRFAVVPVFMLAGAVALLLAGARRRSRTKSWIGPSVFVAHIALVTVIGFSVVTLRSHASSWSASVDRVYRSECRGRAPNRVVQIPEVFGAAVRVECRDLKG